MAERVYPFEAVLFNSMDCELCRCYCDTHDQMANAVFELLETIEDGDRIEFKVNDVNG